MQCHRAVSNRKTKRAFVELTRVESSEAHVTVQRVRNDKLTKRGTDNVRHDESVRDTEIAST